MEIIKNNYIIIIIVGLFLLFALIGYLIDVLRNTGKEEIKLDIPDETKSIELNKLVETNNESNESNDVETIESEENPDDLLKNYEEE